LRARALFVVVMSRTTGVALALCAAAAASASSSASSSGCTTDEDCQLLGRCVASACQCPPAWSGSPDCSTLSLLPAPKPAAYGWAPNVTTWGGNIIPDPSSNPPTLYHLFVAEMAEGCGLDTWQSNSVCRHATASSPTGPFVAQEVAVPAWCHNPQAIAYRDPATGTTTYALFHIGDGVPVKPVQNCSSSSTPLLPHRPEAPMAGSTVHLSSSLNGPWTPLLSPSPPTCNNPSPMQHPNGTLFLLCSNGGPHFELWSTPALQGPSAAWRLVVSIATNMSGGVVGAFEDPFLFPVDPITGYWHALAHVYVEVPEPTCTNTTVSAHLFSRDGLSWRVGATQPYGSIVEFTDGTSMVVPTRERPKVLFDQASGAPTHLVNGATGGCDICLPHWCSHCKIMCWDFTLSQPIATN
jgi:hypothetical protein